MTSTQARNRTGAFGIGTGPSNNPSNKGFGSGFGNGSDAWSNGIWSGKAPIGSGIKNGIPDAQRAQNLQASSTNAEIISGSGSLLPSSESDSYNPRNGSWKSVDDTSPHLSRVNTNNSNTSPMRRQNSNLLAPHTFSDANPANSSYFPANSASTTISSRPSQKNFLDPTSGNFVSGGFGSGNTNRPSRHNSDEEDRFAARKLAFEGHGTRLGMQPAHPPFNANASGYDSSAASRSGSMPPPRNDVDLPPLYKGDASGTQLSRFSQTTQQRQNLSARAPPYLSTNPVQKHGDQLSPLQMNQLFGEFNNLHVGRDTQHSAFNTHSENSYGTSSGFDGGYNQDNLPSNPGPWDRDDSDYQGQQEHFSPAGSGSVSILSNPSSRRTMGYGQSYSQSPSLNDTRLSHTSPYYSTTGTPPTYQPRTTSRGGFGGSLVTGQAAVLDRKLRGVQQEQQAYMVPRTNNVHYGRQYAPSNPYEFHAQQGLPMSQLNTYYPMPSIPHHMVNPHVPREPARDHELAQAARSPLLEEFRNNSKTNKRYELKDIYGSIVEFSGDQHGSRFIQQKLETANSDEKDQVFRELSTNAIQLMTDVFGNYVIQKFFEHGNQAQKKVLANQMRNHILTLSTQMYGCRVVQKALEHILTDQQAQLIKELENNVLKCVKDQNGNHVVQKAIERVPAEHIQFILNAFTGQVQGLATHPYGCRVIQRMLEHCEEPTQSAVLREIHDSASSLILDQFGNYVAQHIIEFGKDEDRARLVNLVISQLTNFSKHKFASNVVEKSIQFGSKEERRRIVTSLTIVNERGESPAQSLIRDQYGNYVIQKLLNELKGSERDEFVELIKAQLALLKRFSYGKQIAAIEKIIYNTPFPQQLTHGGLIPPIIDATNVATPPLLTDTAQSPQSSSLPSTHASSIAGQNESRKSSGSNANGVLTPTST